MTCVATAQLLAHVSTAPEHDVLTHAQLPATGPWILATSQRRAARCLARCVPQARTANIHVLTRGTAAQTSSNASWTPSPAHTQHAATQQTLLQDTPSWALMHTPQPSTYAYASMRQACAGHAHAARRGAALQPSQCTRASTTAAPSITDARRAASRALSTHGTAGPCASHMHSQGRGQALLHPATAQCRTNMRTLYAPNNTAPPKHGRALP